jgi:acetyl-CoA carboxylase carboxyl transferase subunit beta
MSWSFTEEWDTELRSADPLGFPGYAEKLAGLRTESVRTGLIEVGGAPAVLIEGDFDVIGGSMGLVHGEKVVRAYDRAVGARLPVVIVTRSGGARMQEGMVSLVQLARVAASARRHTSAGLFSVAVLRSPTTGGVFASYGSLTDLRVAEAGATLGFAGPRVSEAVTGEPVGERSHTAESALASGLIDGVVPVDRVEAWIEAALGRREAPLVAPPLPAGGEQPPAVVAGDAWSEVQAARAPGRPSGIHVAAAAASAWVELAPGTDPALRTGLATIAGHRVVLVASDRHAGTGRPGPDGFRLVRRGIGLAGRLGLPVVTLVDTPGAEPGPDAENGGIAGELARTFADMADLPTPSISVCVGEGGSGGALALAAADLLLVQEHAVFSVIGPEGAAVILERDAARAPQVAPLLGLTSADLVRLGIVDGVVSDDLAATVATVQRAVRAAVEGAEVVGEGPAVVLGHRTTRFDQASRRWLVDGPGSPA